MEDKLDFKAAEKIVTGHLSNARINNEWTGYKDMWELHKIGRNNHKRKLKD